MTAVGKTSIKTDKVYSRDYLKNLNKNEVVKIYRSIFHSSPYCHTDEKFVWEEIYDAIITGIPQKIDPNWD